MWLSNVEKISMRLDNLLRIKKAIKDGELDGYEELEYVVGNDAELYVLTRGYLEYAKAQKRGKTNE